MPKEWLDSLTPEQRERWREINEEARQHFERTLIENLKKRFAQ